MQAVILAAGKSTRTYPLTLSRPKCMLKLANKPIMEYNLEALSGLVEEVIIVVGYKKDLITKTFGNSFGGMKITYVEQKQQLGTGHALQQAEKYIKGRFAFLMGDDVYSREDISACIRHGYSVLGKRVKDVSRFGVFVLKGGMVEDFIEKPEGRVEGMANCGLYVLDRKIFQELGKIGKTKRGEYEITDAIKSLARKEEIRCVPAKGWISFGYPWDMLEADRGLLEKIKPSNKGILEDYVIVKGKVQIGRGTLIRSGCYIEGPVVIGEDCIIGPNTLIKESSIGDKCQIGNAEIKRSIIMEGSKLKHFCYIGDSVIGSNANIAAGTITANLRHDRETVRTVFNEDKMDTGRKKFGAILGDDVHTGVGTLIYPGRKIWPGKQTAPGQVVKEDMI